MLFVTSSVNWPLFQLTNGTVGNDRGLTVIVKLCVALRLGEPLSATFSVTGLMVLASVTAGRQLKAALVLLIGVNVALAGALSRLKVSVGVGELVSVATAVTATVWPTLTVWLAIGASVGAVLAARKLALMLPNTDEFNKVLLCAVTARPA